MELDLRQTQDGKWLHVPDYASRFGLHTETVYSWVKVGFIPYATYAGKVMIPVVCGKREKWRGGRRR